MESPERPEPGSKIPVSGYVLILANLVPVVGVLIFDWSAFDVVILFWAENVVIGVLNVFRMWLCATDEIVARVGLSVFFSFHYGMFTFVHGVFVFSLFNQDRIGLAAAAGEPAAMIETMLALNLGIPLLALALSHLYSFIWNYLGKGEYLTTTLTQLMKRPYGRVVVLHISIIVGGFLVMLLGSPAYALLILIAIKTTFDFKAHCKEHFEKLTPSIEGEPTMKEILAQLRARERGKRAAALAAESSLDKSESRL